MDSQGHVHDHASMDRELLTHAKAMRAIWISVAMLGATAVAQLAIVAISGSVGLFADALHNLGDVAGTASLWVALRLSRRAASDEFPYGWRRAEDLAGLFILVAIAASAALAGWESITALLGGARQVTNLGLAFGAALLGVVGNEGAARYRIHVGRQIDSVALVADGQHARTDGLASAAAAIGILGVWLGFPLADPLAGLAITSAIVWILCRTGRDVLRRTMDAVEPSLLPRIREVVGGIDGVCGVHDVRARYLGRGLVVQLHAEVDPDLPLRAAHDLAEQVRHRVVHEFPQLVTIDVHLDPAGVDGAHDGTAHHFGSERGSKHKR
ncbi:MAG: cation diffusion facilitator family transporter [Egibacteraceae bacterium]